MKYYNRNKKDDLTRIAFWITIAFIVIAPIENILRTEQYVYIVGIILLGSCILKRKMIIKNNSAIWACYLIYYFVACAWSVNQNVVSGIPVVAAELLFLMMQLQFKYTGNDFEIIKRAFIIQGWILLLLCMTFGSYMDNRFWLKSASSGADPNYLSGWFIIPICYSIEYLFSRKTKSIIKLMIVFQIVLSFYFIMQSASKSGLITNAIAVVAATLYTVKGTIKKHPFRAGLIVVLMIIGIMVALNYMPAYLVTRFKRGSGSLSGRIPMWISVMNSLINNPLALIFGFGTGSVSYHTGTGMVSHNTFLDIFCNQGLIGLTIVLFLMFSNLKYKWRSRPYATIALLSMSVLVFTLSAFNTRFFCFILFIIGANISNEDGHK